jgi:hypothetical protein
VLQPNQHLIGSNVFTLKEEELVRTAASWELEQGQCVDDMYPMLVAVGKQMADDGIVFSDQAACSWIFRKQSTRMDAAITIREDMNCWPIRLQISSTGICSRHTL